MGKKKTEREKEWKHRGGRKVQWSHTIYNSPELFSRFFFLHASESLKGGRTFLSYKSTNQPCPSFLSFIYQFPSGAFFAQDNDEDKRMQMKMIDKCREVEKDDY